MEILKQQSKKERDEQKANNRAVVRVIFWILVILAIGGSVFATAKLAKISKNSEVAGGTVSQVGPTDHTIGNASSSLVLVEYSDFQCPACKAYSPIVKELVATYKDEMLFVYRHFPLYQIHLNARITAQATEAANNQGKFWEMHDILFANQAEWSSKSPSNIEVVLAQYAGQIGLDVEKFKADLNSVVAKDRVAADLASGMKAQVGGTPTFFLNGRMLDHEEISTDQKFKALIDKALADIKSNQATSTVE
jgi:protein-disulfide isomerase